MHLVTTTISNIGTRRRPIYISWYRSLSICVCVWHKSKIQLQKELKTQPTRPNTINRFQKCTWLYWPCHTSSCQGRPWLPKDAIASINNIYWHSTTMFAGNYVVVHEQFAYKEELHKVTRWAIYYLLITTSLMVITRRNGYSFKTSNIKISSTLYIDDLAIIANKLTSLQNQLNKLDEYYEWVGMDLWIPKCAVIGCPNKSN